MMGGDSGERNAWRGQWGSDCSEGTMGKRMRGGDSGERNAWRGLWGKG